VAARHSAATPEHYTPPWIVEGARRTMGGIDLDPFSCATANGIVRAARFYSLAAGEDGFTMPWHGRAFVNPPGGKSSEDDSSKQKAAWFKLAAEHDAGHVSAALFVCFSVELLQTTQSKTPAGARIPLDFPICYPAARVAYYRVSKTAPLPGIGDGLEVGGSPPHSSCIIYLPPPSAAPMWHRPGVQEFLRAFGDRGRCVVPAMVCA
jgi:hypothetical protein